MNKKSIVLVGMSNVGKSYWREKLAQSGFNTFCCDDKIESKLEPLLKQAGYKGIEDVARWMGQPYESQSLNNQSLYLNQEILVMKEAIRELQNTEQPLVIDTTGSVTYTGEETFQELRELATVVLLDAPERIQAELYRRYLAEPKPVIWGDTFQPQNGESPEQSLARCYPILLQNRNNKYREFAHVILDYDEIRLPGLTAEEFLKKIRQ